MDKMQLEAFREDLRQRVDHNMDRSELKEFADYVLERDYIREDYYQMFIRDMYDNYLEDKYQDVNTVVDHILGLE
jgi:dephospho-CoA kinase